MRSFLYALARLLGDLAEEYGDPCPGCGARARRLSRDSWGWRHERGCGWYALEPPRPPEVPR